MLNQDNKSPVFIITGMHRSGTSLTASLMQSAGVHIGKRLMGAAHGNPKGHFENLDFVGFHEYALRSQGISQEGWTIQKNIQTPHQFLDKAKLIIAENERSNYWGWKDPRTTLFLNLWKNLLPQAYFIFTYRSPWEVIDSLYRRGDEIFCSNPTYALQIWMHYNQIILDFHYKFPEQSLLLNTETIIADHTVLSKLCVHKLGIQLKEPSEDILDKSLMKNLASDYYRQMLIKKFFPEAVDLYNDLNNQADIRCQPVHLDGLEVDSSFRDWVLQDWLDVYKIRNHSKKELEDSQSQLQQTQAELERSQSQLQQTQSELEQSQSQLQQTQSELEQSQSHLKLIQLKADKSLRGWILQDWLEIYKISNHAKKELDRSQSQVQQTQSKLERSQSQVQQTQSKLEQSQSQLKLLQDELQRAKSQLQKTQAKLEKSQSNLVYAQTLITAMQTSKFWKLRVAWFKIKAFFNLVPATEMFTPNKVLNIVSQTEDKLINTDSTQKDLSTDSSLKMFAFISGCPGDSYRYRCHHQAEIIKNLGYTVDVYEPLVFLYEQLLKKYRIIVAHRVPHTYEFEQFVLQAKQLGIIVVFDTDDLVFDPSRLSQIDAYTTMDKHEKELYEDGVRRYRKSLSLCDYITVSTDKLQEVIQESFPNKSLIVLRNCISHEMEQGAIEARKSYVPKDEKLRIAYFSGTKTHAKDFAECVLALKSILAEFPHVRLMVVGHLDIPEELQAFSSQIEYVPFMPWRDLPNLYRKVDINLAPLEQNNDFTESKSELKYFEAALLSVPTVASDLGAFSFAIQDGVNGRLCKNADEWQAALYELITNDKLRQQIGLKAFEDVNSRYLTRVATSENLKLWNSLLDGSSIVKNPLSIAFILRAPIAQTGGGYKQIFYLAHYLAEHGHQVHIYVEPIAHLAGFTTEQIQKFCEDNFGKSQAIIHCGHAGILESDVAIATNWPTAYVVHQLVNARFKGYFIQDYEPYFYAPEDSCFKDAEATYDLPLRMICIGRYLAEVLSKRNGIKYPCIDFSLNETFLAKEPNLERHLNTDKPCSILFFARPNIPRRNFALGVKTLDKLYKHNPNVQIKFYGMAEALDLPFPYENLGILTQAETAEAMRSSDIHLSFSMTNISTVVFEAMACGCVAVEADVPPVRAMVDDDTCILCEPNVEAVFEALIKVVTNSSLRHKIATSGYHSVKHLTVENMCSQFENIIKKYSFRYKH
jgi:glycosyltransferase involved in cell wall biosynthesis